MNIIETVYISRDNDIILALANNKTTINHSTLTRVQIYVGDLLFDSLTSPNLFDFTNPAKLTISLGAQAIPVGRYKARLYAYDLDNENGLAWGEFAVIVKY